MEQSDSRKRGDLRSLMEQSVLIQDKTDMYQVHKIRKFLVNKSCFSFLFYYFYLMCLEESSPRYCERFCHDYKVTSFTFKALEALSFFFCLLIYLFSKTLTQDFSSQTNSLVVKPPNLKIK